MTQTLSSSEKTHTVTTDIDSLVSAEMQTPINQIKETRLLLDDGATVPFIARYRKERTGSLDEVAVATIRDLVAQHRLLDDRKATILNAISAQGKLNPTLEHQVRSAKTMAAVEDIYLPYKQKRKTKASVARGQGLEPLAHQIWMQTGVNPEKIASAFIQPEKKVLNIEDALTGARHIIAETINEDATIRERMRHFFATHAVVKSSVQKEKETSGQKFKDYFDWSEKASEIPSHRLLAIRRGESEGVLTVSIRPPEEDAVSRLVSLVLKSSGPDGDQVQIAARDAYKRLLSRALETELRVGIKTSADHTAIQVFTGNLFHLLMAPPLGSKKMIAIDPGLRTGCKVVCLDAKGDLLHTETIFPHSGAAKASEAEKSVKRLLKKFSPQAVAIGNGTAGRETEAFIKPITGSSIPVIMVNESGASIYSASAIAREEFPDHDITVRGAVSIGRRLMDPLAELVKLDPKSIGVGQYQHDVDQSLLKQALDDVVVRCVNQVGVDVNTASPTLLSYVSGLGPTLAKNIALFRETYGAFTSRSQLKKVPRLGPKAFEQSAGFLRIASPKNPLDASAVHPEHYAIVKAMAADAGCEVKSLMTDKNIRLSVNLKKYVTASVGMPTLSDIFSELEKPGRDPRDSFSSTSFADNIHDIKDLKEGLQLPGVVTNVTAFGAFIDIGVHQDGLVHISQMADRFIKNPHDVVCVGQQVMVRVLTIDIDRKRIGLSMKSPDASEDKPLKNKPGQTQPFNSAMAQALKK